MRILWIEDRPEQITYHVQLLRADGHDITLSGSGEGALKAVRDALDGEVPFDAVILDIMLPRGEGDTIDDTTRPELMGEEVLRQMQDMGVSIPVIGVSAIADEPLRARIKTNHSFVSQVLKKPVKMDELRDAVSRAAPASGSGKEGA